jgi:hypothetical protein
MAWHIVGQGKIGQTTFDGKIFVGLDIDGSVELRTEASQAYSFPALPPALLVAQLLTTHDPSRLSFTTVEVI